MDRTSNSRWLMTEFDLLATHSSALSHSGCLPRIGYLMAQSPDEPASAPRLGNLTADNIAPTTDTPSRVRVVVADDDVLLREGLASLLGRSGFEVVGQVGDGDQLLAMVRDMKPELVVTDIRMPPTNTTEGLDAARVIREELPEIGILILSAHIDVQHAMDLLAGGHAVGYLLKSRIADMTEFIDSLHRIAKGASVVDPALIQELVSARRREDPLDVLS